MTRSNRYTRDPAQFTAMEKRVDRAESAYVEARQRVFKRVLLIRLHKKLIEEMKLGLNTSTVRAKIFALESELASVFKHADGE